MQTFYSPKLQLTHAFLRFNVRDPEERMGEAYNIFDQTMKKLLNQAPNASSFSSEAALSGKIMHIKTFVEKDPTTGLVNKGQIRCYFAYRNT
jgi:hypothetical protein